MVLCIALLCACNSGTESSQEAAPTPLLPGKWSVTMDAGNTQIPLRMYITEQMEVQFINGTEVIKAGQPGIKNDSLYIELPVYGTYLTGYITDSASFSGSWHYPQRAPDYTIPFKANYLHSQSTQDSDSEQNYESRYAVRFSPDTEDEYPAVGLFHQADSRITGTFLTETGDYRFLEGEVDGSSFWLSCFDGAHLFHFDGEGWGTNSITGNFYSGKHWQEPWSAELNDQASLRHPDSLTYMVDPTEDFELNLVRTDGEFVHFDKGDFQDKVTIVQIFGSWCPNCLDESIYYNALYSKYQEQGLQIIPVAFERSEDFETSSIGVQRYLNELDVEYPGYIGGKASKKVAAETFPMLNHIISFPTSIFIDKTGEVRKVHTGFYGPGTGEYYTRYTERTDLFIKQLLA